MPILYLYIDDQPEKASGIAAGLSVEQERLTVKLSPAEVWARQIQTILNSRQDINGLLLDLQISIPADTFFYDAPAIAQQIRNLAKEGKIDDLPILLCTTNDLFIRVYDKATNEDLFDKVYFKDDWIPNVNQQVFREFISLAEGYEIIRKVGYDRIEVLLTINDQNSINQIVDKIQYPQTVHSVAQFILKQLIMQTGLLVDENVLAIRLGIDTAKSAGWAELLERLSEFKYAGIFSEAWPRWWIGDIMKWWRQTLKGKTLRSLTAEERVEFIKESLGIESLSAIPIPEHHTFSQFWYRCKLSGVAMNDEDGVIIKGQDRKLTWQDKDYISYFHLWSIDSQKQEQDVRGKLETIDSEKVETIFRKKRM